MGRRPPVVRVVRLQRREPGPEAGADGIDRVGYTVWASQRVRIHFGNAVRFGQRIFASNGDFGSAPLAAIDVTTGDMVWRDRSVGRATLLGAGSRLILLDEDGNLALATPGDTGLVVQAKAQILDGRSWTAPTLSGTTLFVRNQKEIVALDLR